MQLLRSKIVPAAADALWAPLPERWLALPPADALILSTPFEPQTAEETTLLKLLEACKLAPQKNAHILMMEAEQITSWHRMYAHFLPQYVLTFGIHPQNLGISAMFALYMGNAFGGSTFIPSVALSQLQNNAAAKKALWEGALKPIFAGI